MQTKRVLHYHKPGDLAGLERTLNGMSARGWQAERPGRFVQRCKKGEGVYSYRLGCGDKKYIAAQEKAGWELVGQKKELLLFRKDTDEEETLVGHRDCFAAAFEVRIRRLESIRRVLLILAALLMIAGYTTDILPILYSSALPLCGMILVTYRIKFLEEGLTK